ncbi:MAG: DEAD/DEAH box helicase [Spirochaetaceae bacterium]|nr:DEAD/DEAH box helicase [Spirochaetaceae bacterium]
MKKLLFNELGLSEYILNAVTEMGFEEASPIQSETIPMILSGKDIIGQAQTGTGKTAAFAIPVIEKLDVSSGFIQALILCPTRELVIQVTEEFRKLMKFNKNNSDSAVVAVYGGQEIERQFKALKKKPFIIVGTPGRIMDHMRRKSISFSKVSMVVLDEADEMLDMGFREDIEYILNETPSTRQTVMFSATMSKEILSLTDRFQKDPVFIDVTSQKINSPIIDQMYFEISEKAKPEAVARLIDFYNIKLALIFCNTKTKVDEVVEILKTRGYFAEGLHGDMSQRQREKVMSGFRNGIVEVLVATDVAGRGIDVNDINAVFNYDLPRDDEDYIHRIGRTGRAGKSGRSFTFVNGREIYHLRRIERVNGIKVTRGTIPTIGDLDNTASKIMREKIISKIQEGQLSRYINIVENIISDEYTSMDIAAALLKLTMAEKNEGYDESQTFEITRPSSKSRKPSSKESIGKGRSFTARRPERSEYGKSKRRESNNKIGYEKEENKKYLKPKKQEKFKETNFDDRKKSRPKKEYSDTNFDDRKKSRPKKEYNDTNFDDRKKSRPKKEYSDTYFDDRKKSRPKKEYNDSYFDDREKSRPKKEYNDIYFADKKKNKQEKELPGTKDKKDDASRWWAIFENRESARKPSSKGKSKKKK